uniref:Uncharacterized protein LOC100177002 n=1 Tax=Phallusia mammillata TaxID=59560 RepID=A0A6F9DG20_9ASCI|nr:uncharacterized protein LOC100177002 [Phallusia mammillata]
MLSVHLVYLFCFCVAFAFAQTAVPVGHLKPLGAQRPPSIDIDEFTIDTAPHPAQFYEEYVKPSKAAIFRGVMLDTKAYKLWTDEYIKENYGNLEVRLEGKKEKIHMTPIGEKYLGRDTLGHFIDHYHDNESKSYIVSELPVPMHGDVGVLPSLGACGQMGKHFVEIDIWWSGGGSSSVIHKDAFNQINCLYRGKKYWKLYEYKYEKWIYKHWEPENEIGGFSDINVAAVDLFQHPDFAKVPWSEFTINEGDCLFLPKSYYHQVESPGPQNLAVSILYGRMDGFESINTTDCTKDTDYKTPRPLSDFDVMWKWSGKGVMSMGRGDFEEGYRNAMISTAKDLEDSGQIVNARIIEDMFGDPGEDDGKLREANYTKAFGFLDTNGDGKLSSQEARDLSWQQLRDFGNEIEFVEPSNNYEFEYSFISYDAVRNLLYKSLAVKPKIARKGWINAYTKRLGGTPAFANEIFTKLAGSEKENYIISEDITDEMINHALERWIYYWAPQYSDSKERPGTEVEEEEPEEDEDKLFLDSPQDQKEKLEL